MEQRARDGRRREERERVKSRKEDLAGKEYKEELSDKKRGRGDGEKMEV